MPINSESNVTLTRHWVRAWTKRCFLAYCALVVMLGALMAVVVLRPQLLKAVPSRLLTGTRMKGFHGGLRLRVLRGWEVGQEHIVYWTLLGKVQSQLSIKPMAESRWFADRGKGLYETRQWQQTAVGGVAGQVSTNHINIGKNGTVLVLLTLETKDVFISFSGEPEHWDRWWEVLADAKWQE